MDFKHNHKIDVMISRALKGKAPPDFDWRSFHSSFRRYTLTPHQLAGAIHKGFSFTPVFDGRRKEQNFVESWHIAFDFDSEGASLDYLMREGSFAETFATFAYETPSSTEENPRARVVFVFDFPLKSPQRMRELYQAIAWRFNQDGSITDEQCKDPLRLYYGSPGCNMRGNWAAIGTQSLWDDAPSMVDVLISEYKIANPPIVEQMQSKTPVTKNQAEVIVNRMIDGIRHAPAGEKHNQRNRVAFTVGGIVAAGQIDESNALALLEDAALDNTDNPKLAAKEVAQALEDGKQRPLALELPALPNYTEILF